MRGANSFYAHTFSTLDVGGSSYLEGAAVLVGTLCGISESVVNFAKEPQILTKWHVGITTALVWAKVASLDLGYAWTFIKWGLLLLGKIDGIFQYNLGEDSANLRGICHRL
jgi:hypothetical protein